ncbi:threonine/homoserine/homoserine lactone efflux protein [Maritalea mobilis]|uniref:Threonine/homoserine/homoserine lactone efflux protein n=1 Tax=Maritalea mobilis TaxID=483324 RepID=A0A4V3DBR1_9HYPH|nr:LysE family translocator [Maritalea mobilis]TDQ67488.1 threonine/homoserine/homoserine lactone efflux protein [Maritalea mobilis]
MSLEFLLTSLVVVLLPGTGVLYTLAIGLSRGFKMSVMAAFGCTLGIIPAALASVVGLAAILHTSALAFQLIKYAGVAYLFYMAWGILREGGALDVEKAPDVKSARKTIRDGALLNVLNPKLSLFFLAFLPQFVPASVANPTPLMLSLAAIFMGMTFIVFVGYGACASLARDFVLSRPNVLLWLRRGFAGTFGFLGLKLAFSDR